jgi:hypothetical protein
MPNGSKGHKAEIFLGFGNGSDRTNIDTQEMHRKKIKI